MVQSAKKLLIITQKVDENDQLLGFFVPWIKLIQQNFDKTTVLCLERGEYGLPDSIEVISMGKEAGKGKMGRIYMFYKTIFGLRKNYDIVFVHMNPIWVVLGGLFWRLMGKKIFMWYTSGGVTLKLQIATMLSHHIFSASPESFRLKSNKIQITGHGIDTEFFKPMLINAKHKLRLLSVGRIAKSKNYEVLIKATKILLDKGFKFEVHIIGEVPKLRDEIKYFEHIKQMIHDAGIENVLTFLGKINNKDLAIHYQSADIFIHMSKTGSLDKTLLEAMSSGMKVISSSDSAREFLSESLLFDGDDDYDLANKIQSVASSIVDPKLRKYVVENHSLPKLINKLSKAMNYE